MAGYYTPLPKSGKNNFHSFVYLSLLTDIFANAVDKKKNNYGSF